MFLTIGLIGLAVLAVGCAVFVGLAPSPGAPEPRPEPAREPSGFFVAGAEPRPPEELVAALLRDLEAHIREEGRIADGFAARMDLESLRVRARSTWVN